MATALSKALELLEQHNMEQNADQLRVKEQADERRRKEAKASRDKKDKPGRHTGPDEDSAPPFRQQ